MKLLDGDKSIDKKSSVFYILGKAILMASMQFAIGSVEMSSKFSVKNFAKDQETLNNAISALRDYIIIGALWTIGTGLIFGINYGQKGFILNLISNVSIILWIYLSYYAAFNEAAGKNNLVVTNIFEV
jgi:hypothetical protein